MVKNWDNEFVKWLGPGTVRTLAIADQDRKTVEKNIDLFVKTKMFKILIASYECIRTHVGRLNKHKHACDLLVCDEAHRLKNRDNQTSRALNSLQVRRRVLLTGTPMQNDLSEFFAMVDFTNPGILGTEEEFRRKILNPILRGREPDATVKQKQKMMDIQQNMSNIVNEFILRRINTLNAQHLPPKLVQVVCCKLTDMQRNMYQHLVTSKDLQHVLDGKQQNCLSSIQMLMKLCNHPKLVVEEDTSASRGGRRGNKKICYAEDAPSSAAPGADGISKFLPYSSSNGIHPEWSGKMFVLYRLMYEMRRPGNGNDKIVIISNYTQTLDLIGKMCKENNWKSCRLDGSVGMKKRQAMVDEFNDPTSSLVAFLLSSKAGGCGINLIGGNRLVLFDPDWNPAVDKQAAARCWREGQKKRCFTYRFLASGTVEEKIFQRQLSKEGLQSIVDDKEQVNALSTKDLQKLFKLREDTPSDTHDKLNCQRCKLTKDNAEEMDRLTLPKRLAACKVLLEVMMERDDSQFFSAPLDPTQYDVSKEQYEALVKQPMDLGTVMAKLSRTLDQLAIQQSSSECKPANTKVSGYESASQFSKDVNRVFANITKVWAPGCELSDASRMLQSWWLEQWTGLVPKLMSMKPDYNDDGNDTSSGSDEQQQQEGEENGATAADESNERGEDYQEQIGMPDEENMRSWSHHFSTDTCDDPIFRAAMRGFDNVSFVFGLEVTWSLIQQRQQEEEEQKAMEALEQLQACENNDEDGSNGGGSDSDEDENDVTTNCEKKKLSVELLSSSDEESDDDGSAKNDGDEETWNLSRVLSPTEMLKTNCQSEDCELQACSIWKSNSGEEWSTCLDCQSQDFGDWPKKKKPSDFEMGAIVKHCSKVGGFIVEDDEESENEDENEDEIEEEVELIDDDNDEQSDQESVGDASMNDNDDTVERSVPISVDKENHPNFTTDGTNAEEGWTCPQCTYGNKSSARSCGICTVARPNKRTSDVSSPMSVASRARLS
uniref:RanBP2-type domain-containing protein n=1 Tax=Leptocylindrus danicus TaxID=163516 RepID=A0A7S2KDU5_9STRA